PPPSRRPRGGRSGRSRPGGVPGSPETPTRFGSRRRRVAPRYAGAAQEARPSSALPLLYINFPNAGAREVPSQASDRVLPRHTGGPSAPNPSSLTSLPLRKRIAVPSRFRPNAVIKPPQILIVEEDEVRAEEVRRALEPGPYGVVWARDLPQVLAFLT